MLPIIERKSMAKSTVLALYNKLHRLDIYFLIYA